MRVAVRKSRRLIGPSGGGPLGRLLSRLAILTVLAAACGQDRPANVVIIGIDSLRPDHLGCYGYVRPTSPNIDELGARGVLFENVISQASWTTPSFATVFTSLYPSQHGALEITDMLRAGVPTLAEVLKARGYATAGIANAPALSTEYGFDRGFDWYDVAKPETRNAEATTRDALDWIGRNRQRPFFIFIHYFDVHLPYAPPPSCQNLFDPNYAGSLGMSFDPDSLAPTRDDLLAMMRGWSEADWNHVKSLYDGEIVITDQAVGELVKGLARLRLTKNTLLVVLSDHGQEFFEHGAYGHGHSLHGEVLRVPLIFSLPGKVPMDVKVSVQARLLDVAPTILDILGIDSGIHYEGASLVPLFKGAGGTWAAPEGVLPPDLAFSEGIRFGTEKKSLTGKGAKVIHEVESGRTEAFDLVADPGETNDLAGAPPHNLVDARRTMFKAVFEMTDAWHIEIDGGREGHVFDLAVSAGRGSLGGSIQFARTIDAAGDFHLVRTSAASAAGGSMLDLKDVAVREPFHLVFKSEPSRFPVRFELSMDGQPATGVTYLGASLERVERMPFSQNPGKAECRSAGEAGRRPEPPYILVWLARAPYGGESVADLSEKVKHQLRALGYLQ